VLVFVIPRSLTMIGNGVISHLNNVFFRHKPKGHDAGLLTLVRLDIVYLQMFFVSNNHLSYSASEMAII